MAAIGWNEAAAADANRFTQGKRDAAAKAGDAARSEMERREAQVVEHVDDWRDERERIVGEATAFASYSRGLAKAEGGRSHRTCFQKADAIAAASTAADLEQTALDAEAEAAAAHLRPAPPPPAPTVGPRPRDWPVYPLSGGRVFAADCGRCGELVQSPTPLDLRRTRCTSCARARRGKCSGCRVRCDLNESGRCSFCMQQDVREAEAQAEIDAEAQRDREAGRETAEEEDWARRRWLAAWLG